MKVCPTRHSKTSVQRLPSGRTDSMPEQSGQDTPLTCGSWTSRRRGGNAYIRAGEIARVVLVGADLTHTSPRSTLWPSAEVRDGRQLPHSPGVTCPGVDPQP